MSDLQGFLADYGKGLVLGGLLLLAPGVGLVWLWRTRRLSGRLAGGGALALVLVVLVGAGITWLLFGQWQAENRRPPTQLGLNLVYPHPVSIYVGNLMEGIEPNKFSWTAKW